MNEKKRSSRAGIRLRHRRSCGEHTGAGCTCRPTYEASVYSARDEKKIRKSFPTFGAARSWQADAAAAVRRGTLRTPSRITVREEAERFLADARSGAARTRSGDPYKPSSLRGYEQALHAHVLPELGNARLATLERRHVQNLADRLVAQGLDPSTVHNALTPLKVIYRRALRRGDVALNPTNDLDLPAVRGRRDRVAGPIEAASLLAAVPDSDRAVWATAMYAGLRLGELRALLWEHVDLKAGVISVERSWDAKEGPIEPKSEAGKRTVPITSEMKRVLAEHRLRTGRATGLVFGRTAELPFDASTVGERAKRHWKTAGLQPIGFHECRHSCASLMIGAGINAKAISTYLGHSSITITLDRYGHLLPGDEADAAARLDSFLSTATSAATASAD